jgi:inosose dehydratase
MSARLASGPVSWGVDFADGPANPPWTEVLDGIAAAGYAGTELGPYGYLPLDPAPLARRGLTLTGGFVFEPLHDPSEARRIVRLAREVATAVRELGGTYVLLIDSVSASRAATAGSVADAARLSDARRDAMAEAIDAASAAVASCGATPLLHPHAGTYVEFADEIEALAPACALCVDTGHLAYAGIDPAAFVAGTSRTIGCVHLKDLDRAGLRPGFWASVAAGAFVPLGQGEVDFGALLTALDAQDYDGWLVVEQDRAAATGDPVADLAASRRFVEGAA